MRIWANIIGHCCACRGNPNGRPTQKPPAERSENCLPNGCLNRSAAVQDGCKQGMSLLPRHSGVCDTRGFIVRNTLMRM